MAEKKYQVFISSTYADLKEERRKILDILLMADCIPAGMEAFVASDVEQALLRLSSNNLALDIHLRFCFGGYNHRL